VDISLSPLTILSGGILSGCSKLVSLTLPATLRKREGGGHFRGTGLPDFEATVRGLHWQIAQLAFEGTCLSAFKFASSLVRIGYGAFHQTSLHEVDLRSGSLMVIDETAFADCGRLLVVRVGRNVAIEKWAFGGSLLLACFEAGDSLDPGQGTFMTSRSMMDCGHRLRRAWDGLYQAE
jgi:hypothetical protein